MYSLEDIIEKKIFYRVNLKIKRFIYGAFLASFRERYPQKRNSIFKKNSDIINSIDLLPLQNLLKPFLKMLVENEQQYKKLIERSQHLLNNEACIFNGYYSIPNSKLKWNFSILTKQYWPTLHYTKLKQKLTFNDFDNDDYICDILYAWEFGKHHALFDIACLLNINEDIQKRSYLNEQLESWMKSTTLENNIHWMNSLIVSQRCINWLYILALEHDNLKLNKSLYQEFIGELLFSADYVYNNMEFYKFNNNHLISNLAFLILIARIFPKSKKLKRYSDYAKKVLHSELTKQVFDDGVNFEASTVYHRYVTELLVIAFCGTEDSDISLKMKLSLIIQKMLKYISRINSKDYLLPIIGDNYQTKVLPNAENNANNCYSLLNVYQHLVDKHISNNILKNSSHSTEERGMNNTIDPRDYLTSGWLCCFYPNNSDMMILFDTANTGLRGSDANDASSHGHSDALSFILNVEGLEFIVDRGSPEYTGSRKLHDEFRATSSHNTLTIDNCDQCTPSGYWVYERYAPIYGRRVTEDSAKWILEGSHKNYHNKNKGEITHTRKVTYYKKNPSVTIIDSLIGVANSDVDGRLYLHPDVSLQRISKNKFRISRGRVLVFVEFKVGADARMINIEPVETTVSKDYGSIEKSIMISYSLQCVGDTEIEIEFSRC